MATKNILKKGRFFFWFLLVILIVPFFFLWPARVKGRKNLRKARKQGVIFAGNHQSNVDAIYFMAYLRRYQKFVSKVEHSKGFFGFIIRNIGGFFVDRGKPNLQFYKDATKWLEMKEALTIFPEGTRKKNFDTEDMNQLKDGIAMFGIKTRCLIVPVYISKRPGIFRINTLYVGEPFRFEEEQFDRVSKDNLKLATEKLSAEFSKLKQSAIKKTKNH